MRKREMQGCTFMSEKKMNAWSNMNAMKHTRTIQQEQKLYYSNVLGITSQRQYYKLAFQRDIFQDCKTV